MAAAKPTKSKLVIPPAGELKREAEEVSRRVKRCTLRAAPPRPLPCPLLHAPARFYSNLTLGGMVEAMCASPFHKNSVLVCVRDRKFCVSVRELDLLGGPARPLRSLALDHDDSEYCEEGFVALASCEEGFVLAAGAKVFMYCREKDSIRLRWVRNCCSSSHAPLFFKVCLRVAVVPGRGVAVLDCFHQQITFLNLHTGAPILGLKISLRAPSDCIAAGPHGTLFVANSYSITLFREERPGVWQGQLSSNTGVFTLAPSAMAVDARGFVYVPLFHQGKIAATQFGEPGYDVIEHGLQRNPWDVEERVTVALDNTGGLLVATPRGMLRIG
eukprot:m.239303 g.239303  ORF g.239303 m.239303 type:complete len:329 (+) comp22448_c0_seq1:238-1224(+)